MTLKKEILSRFKGGEATRPLFIPDLDFWHRRRKTLNTLPEEHKESSLAEIAADLNCPAWVIHTPWRMEYPGIEVVREESDKKRAVKYQTGAGALTESWFLGPDGDWWKTEYPIKSKDDLKAAEELFQSLTYKTVPIELSESAADQAIIDVIELPRTPYSELLHSIIGWSGGLKLMKGSTADKMMEFLALLEEKRLQLIQELAKSPVAVVLAPDNLDGQYLSPAIIDSHFKASYQKTAEALHRQNKLFVIHIGGFCKQMLPLLAETGADVLSGISGPPQSDASLSEARKETGPDITLWGGIPQDLVTPIHDKSKMIESMREAVSISETDERIIIGIADHTPVEAEFERLKEISLEINGA